MTISDDSARINDSFDKNSKIQLSVVYSDGKIPAKASKNLIRSSSYSAEHFCKTVSRAEADSKELLPVAIAALFGRKKSAGGSFRHNENITALTGIFFDYDGELIDGKKVTLNDIESKLKASDFGGIIYPTSSYPEKGSWRLLLPFKSELALTKLVKIHYCEKRLSALNLSNIEDRNYENLSIPFAFGHVEGTPDLPDPIVVEGDWVSDEIQTDIENADLLELSLEKYLGIEEPKAAAAPLFNSDKQLSDEQIKDALAYVSAHCGRDEWITILAALYHDGRDIELARSWSQTSDQYNKSDFESTWRSFAGSSSSRTASIATLLHKAQVAGWVHPFTAKKRQRALAEELMQELPVKAGVAKKKIKKAASAAWRDQLDLNVKNKPVASASNVRVALENDPNLKGAFGYNEFALIPMQSKATPILPLPDNKPAVLGNLAELKVYFTRSELRGGLGITRVSDSDLKNQVVSVAEQKDNRFHPVRDHLLSLKWDGVARVDRLFVDYLHSEDNCYTREAARLFLVAAVARVMNPEGQQFDNVPIIGGEQNARKTSFVRTLSYGLTGSLHKDLSDVQKTCESMRGKWIIEVAELKSFKHSDIEAMKDFFSAIHDTYRRPYRPDEETFTRQCVFIGTTNAADYLKDKTGNRRFWPIDVKAGHKIDTETLRENLDQIWSEAVVLYEQIKEDAGDGLLYLNLSDEATKIAKQVQESKQVENESDDIADAIISYFAAEDDDLAVKPDSINTAWVWDNILHYTSQPAGKARRDVLDALDKLVTLGKLEPRNNRKRHKVLM